MRWRHVLSLGLVLACVSCGKKAAEKSEARTEPGPFSFSEEEENTQIADRFLRLTEPFRDCECLPQWKTLTSKDMDEVVLDTLYPRSPYSGDGVTIVHPREESEERLRLLCKAPGLTLSMRVDPVDGVLREYSLSGTKEVLNADLEAGRWTRPKLTPREALEKAKSYVVLARGEFPDDLVPVSAGYQFPPDESERRFNPEWRDRTWLGDLWSVTFRRYAGRLEYKLGLRHEDILVRFSERYGVCFYDDRYLSETWHGKIRISQEEALATAAKHVNDAFKDLVGEDTEPQDLTLRWPPYVDGPYLKNFDSTRPRTVRAAWAVVYPFALTTWIWGEHYPGYAERCLQLYVDAEDGQFLTTEYAFSH